MKPIDNTPSRLDAESGAVCVATYRRASLDRGGRGLSITTQTHEVDIVIAKEGWQHVADYGDNNVSGSDTSVRRREFERMLSDIESGAVVCALIAAYDLSRFFRNRRDKAAMARARLYPCG
jgi:DNA invertase Pin-like site-specific DNA recombinase